jgi:hypothetical protein
MEGMLEYVAKGLVDKPDEVRVVKTERDGAVVFVVGRRGALHAAALLQGGESTRPHDGRRH